MEDIKEEYIDKEIPKMKKELAMKEKKFSEQALKSNLKSKLSEYKE